jgi:subtilisin family serine protease
MQNTRSIRLSAAVLALCAGAAASLGDNAVRTPATIIGESIRLQPGDAQVLPVANNAQVVWTTQPGVVELQGSMIIRPITRDDLIARGLTAAQADAQTARAMDRLAPLTSDFVAIHNHVILSLPQGVNENQMSAFLMATGDYQYAEPNFIVYPTVVPNDPSYGTQYAHQRTVSEPAWDITTGSTSVIIAITDTGIVLGHEDLAANLVSGANSATGTAIPQSSGGAVNDINGHGTHCAGIAAARGNNGVGIAGNSWNNRIMPVRVSNSTGGGSSLAALQAGATWAAQNGARVVSTSYSGVNNASNQTVGATLRTSFNSLWFWAAGNANSNLGTDNFPDLQIVASTDSADAKSSFSNFGTPIDIAAPGSSIFATYTPNNNSYATLSGTSMACPNAAGAAALILSVNTALTAVQVRDILYTNADDLGTAGEDTNFGNGRVNMGRAIADAYRISFPITSLPFFDDFEAANFTNARWVYRDTGTSISTNGVGEPSGTRSANVNFARRIETNAINLAGNSSALNLTYASQARGPAAAETLVVEYLNSSNAWVNLQTIASTGTLESTFTNRTVAIPTGATVRHAKFAVRFRAVGNLATDNWYIDNVRIGGNTPPPCPADFNRDGTADFFDYLDFVSAFSNNNITADFNGDNSVDFFDYLDFVSAFDAGCP